MPSWLVQALYLSVAFLALTATVIADALMRPAYHAVQLMMVWTLGLMNVVWPIGFLLQHRVDRREKSAYQLALRRGKGPVILLIVIEAVLIAVSAVLLHKPLG